MQYLATERKGKSPDVFISRGLFERTIAEAAKYRILGEANAEQTLRTLWVGYIDFLVRESGFIWGSPADVSSFRSARARDK